MTNRTTDDEIQTCEIFIQDLEEGIEEQRKEILGLQQDMDFTNDMEEEDQQYMNFKWREASEENCFQCGEKAKTNYQCNNCENKQLSRFMVCDECIRDFNCPFCPKNQSNESSKGKANTEHRSSNTSTAMSSTDTVSIEFDKVGYKASESKQSPPRRWQKEPFKCECKCGCRKTTTSRAARRRK